MYITEEKQLSKQEIINLSLKIIKEFNYIINNNNKLINNLNKIEFNDSDLEKEYKNYYNLFKILNSQNIKQDILYFYKLGIDLIDEKLLNEKKANNYLKNLKLKEYLNFNLSSNKYYIFSDKELNFIKKINNYFDKMLEINEKLYLILEKENFYKQNNIKKIYINNNINELEQYQRKSLYAKLKKINNDAEKVISEISKYKKTTISEHKSKIKRSTKHITNLKKEKLKKIKKHKIKKKKYNQIKIDIKI